MIGRIKTRENIHLTLPSPNKAVNITLNERIPNAFSTGNARLVAKTPTIKKLVLIIFPIVYRIPLIFHYYNDSMSFL